MMQEVKCVLVGDGGVGKTDVIMRYTKNVFAEKTVNTVFDVNSKTTLVDGKKINLSLWDTAGQDDSAHLRPVSYLQTNVVLFCFSIVSPESFESIKNKWLPEVTQHCPDARTMIVGTKADLIDDEETIADLKAKGLSPVSQSAGNQLAKEINAAKYMVCSARTKDGIKALFDEAVRIALNPLHQPLLKRKCVVL